MYERDTINLGLNQDRILGIDLGLTKVVTVVNNGGLQPFIIKGGLVKSMNQYYNKHLAKYKSIKDKQSYKFETRRLQRLNLKRNHKIKDIFHKNSRQLTSYCRSNNFGTIIIGYNEGWKQSLNLGKKTTQSFLSKSYL